MLVNIYVYADRYKVCPAGAGQTMKKLSYTIKAVAQANKVAVCDLWHDSGISSRTWGVFGAQKQKHYHILEIAFDRSSSF